MSNKGDGGGGDWRWCAQAKLWWSLEVRCRGGKSRPSGPLSSHLRNEGVEGVWLDGNSSIPTTWHLPWTACPSPKGLW